MPFLICEHVYFYDLNAWLIMCVCSRKVEAVLLAVFVLFLSPTIHNLDRNSDRNNTSSCFKAILQFLRLSIANQDKTNIDKKPCKHSNLLLFFADEASKVVSQPLHQP